MRFELVTARRVKRSDGVEIGFISKHELQYTKADKSVILFTEAYVERENAAPDGCYVDMASPQWSDKTLLTPEEITTMIADFREAEIPLMTKFRLTAY